MRHLLQTIVYAFIATFLIVVGLVGIVMPWSATLHKQVIDFLTDGWLILFLFGTAFFVIGIAMVVYRFFSFHRRYYEIQSGTNRIILEENLFQDQLDLYWKQLFPNYQTPNQVKVSQRKLIISADLPYIPPAEQRDLLKRIDRDIGTQLNQDLGYQGSYTLAISFETTPPKDPLI